MTKARIAEAATELADLERMVGLPVGFVAGLIDENEDWAFIVKINVVLEAALNAVLAEISPGHDLAEFVGQLGLQGRSGKLALAKSSGVLSPAYAEAFAALASIRNKFVHSLAGLAGSFEVYAKQLSEQERVDFGRQCLVVDAKHVAEFRGQSLDFFASQMRPRIWWCAACLLMALYNGKLTNELRKMKYEIGGRPQPPMNWNLGLLDFVEEQGNSSGNDQA